MTNGISKTLASAIAYPALNVFAVKALGFQLPQNTPENTSFLFNPERAPAPIKNGPASLITSAIQGSLIGLGFSAFNDYRVKKLISPGLSARRTALNTGILAAAGTIYNYSHSIAADTRNKQGLRITDNFYFGRNSCITAGATLGSAALTGLTLWAGGKRFGAGMRIISSYATGALGGWLGGAGADKVYRLGESIFQTKQSPMCPGCATDT